MPAKAKSGKRTDKRPARQRYNISDRLAYRKIRNMVRSGMDPLKAAELWERTRRRPHGPLPSLKKIEALK